MSKPVFDQVGTVWIYTRDLERAVQWYTEKLGLEVAYKWNGGADLAMPKGPMLITIAEKGDWVPSDQPLFGFIAHDIDSAHALLSSRGAEVTPIKDYEMVRCFDMRDPDGNVLMAGYEKPNSPFYMGETQD